MLKNTENSYGIASRFFHWIMALIIIGLLVVGYIMINLKPTPLKWEIYSFHKALGMVVLSLVFLRLIWRFINISPKLPSSMLTIEIIGYRIGVFLMYILMFVMPVSGILMSRYFGHDINVFGAFTIKAAEKNFALGAIASNIHFYSSILLSIIVSIHTILALYHHYVKKDNLLRRMIKGM